VLHSFPTEKVEVTQPLSGIRRWDPFSPVEILQTTQSLGFAPVELFSVNIGVFLFVLFQEFIEALDPIRDLPRLSLKSANLLFQFS